MKKLFFIPLVLAVFSLNAQVFPYELTVLNQDYQQLADPNSFTTTPDWDDFDGQADFGFDFNMFGSTINGILISEPSGLIQIGGKGTMNLYSAMYSDLVNADSLEVVSTVGYVVEGEAPNRIAKLEWNNAGLYGEADSLNSFSMRLNYQVWFYEGTNVFEFRYGSNSITDFFFLNEMSAPFIFFVTDLDFATGSAGAAWSLQGDPTNPAIGDVSLDAKLPPNDAFLTSMPSNGTVYRFAPTVASSVSELNAASFKAYPTVFENNINVNSELNGYNVAILRDLTGKEVQRFNVQKGNQSIDLSNLNSGVYLLQIANTTQRIVKQ
jgi:hypothetical protein